VLWLLGTGIERVTREQWSGERLLGAGLYAFVFLVLWSGRLPKTKRRPL